MHTRTAGELTDHAARKRQDRKYHDAPPDPSIRLYSGRQTLEHEQQRALDRPEGEPEEDLHGKELV